MGPASTPSNSVIVGKNDFADVTTNYWAFNYIEAIYKPGITVGCGNGDYCPYNNVTRGQMAAFIVRAKEGEPAANYCASGSAFSDVSPSDPFCKYIKRLSELGITVGCGNGNYCPDQYVARDQVAAFLSRAFLGMQ
jgi:hypothetical protein